MYCTRDEDGNFYFTEVESILETTKGDLEILYTLMQDTVYYLQEVEAPKCDQVDEDGTTYEYQKDPKIYVIMDESKCDVSLEECIQRNDAAYSKTSPDGEWTQTGAHEGGYGYLGALTDDGLTVEFVNVKVAIPPEKPEEPEKPEDPEPAPPETPEEPPEEVPQESPAEAPSGTDTPPAEEPPAETPAEQPPEPPAAPEEPPAELPAPSVETVWQYDHQRLADAWEAGDWSGLAEKDRAILDKCKEVIDALITDNMSLYDKELAIHDWMIAWADYDRAELDNHDHSQADPDNDNPYGLLVGRKGICLGYTYTFRLFMDLLDIECTVVHGTSHGGADEHAWNMVRLDGEWYCVDVTWDDPITSSPFPLPDTTTHMYFNVTSDFLRRHDHQWDETAVEEAKGTALAWAADY